MNCTLDLISIVMLFLQLFAIFIVLNGLRIQKEWNVLY